jgi:thiamine biosynthesis lipoprotein ApbE
MGTACHLVVVGGPPGLIARAVGVIDGLDARRAANPTVATGFAADVAVEELRRDGAAGACVDLGGVVAVSGQAPAGGEVWHVGVCGSATVGISDAGVATVHVPMTTAGLRAITVVAESAARAQALAIAAWRAGGLTLVSEAGAAALAIDGTGAVHTTPGVEPYLSAA